MWLFKNPKQLLIEGQQLPACLDNDFSRHAGRQLVRNNFVIECDMSSVGSGVALPFLDTQERRSAFVAQNRMFAPTRSGLGVFPKEFLERIPESRSINDPGTKITIPVQEEVHRVLRARRGRRITNVMLVSKYPEYVWRVAFENPRPGREREVYVSDCGLDDLLSEEKYLLRFMKSAIVQGQPVMLVLGAGRKASEGDVSAPTISCVVPFDEYTNEHLGGRKMFDIVPFPEEVLCYRSNNNACECAEAAAINALGALNAYNEASQLEAICRMARRDLFQSIENRGRAVPSYFKSVDEDCSLRKVLFLMDVFLGFNSVHILENKRWRAGDLMDKIEGLRHPVLVEFYGVNAQQTHVVVVFRRHVYCCETKLTYPLYLRNLNYSCGAMNTFDFATRVVALLPPRAIKENFDRMKGKFVTNWTPYNWDRGEIECFKKKKQKKRMKGVCEVQSTHFN